MKKRWILGVSIAACVGFAGFSYFLWMKPYELPDIGQDVPVSQYNFEFSTEAHTFAQLKFIPSIKQTVTLTDLTDPVTALKLYNYALSLFAGDDSAKSLSIRHLKDIVKANPDNMVFSNALRLEMLALNQSDTFVRFVDTLAAPTRKLQLQKALAYVDMLQNPDLGTASLGQRSYRSIQVLEEILKDYPYDFMAHYARGLNNLYWPHGLKRTEKAIQDLGYCLAATKQLSTTYSPIWPLVYEAYGDALIKNGKVNEGIRVWKEGHDRYGEHQGLAIRSRADEKEAVAIVTRVRGIDTFQRPDPSVSNISLLWTDTGTRASGG